MANQINIIKNIYLLFMCFKSRKVMDFEYIEKIRTKIGYL